MTESKPKLLLAGGGYADIPLIEAARDLGFFVITSGNRPEDLGHRVSDKYCNADFSDPEAMLALARDLKIDAVCASCNDFSAISAAYVAEKLDLPGHDSYDTSLLIHHKDRYRELAKTAGIPTPHAESFSQVDRALAAVDNFEGEFIIKPVDLTGGKGITRVADPAIARTAIELALGRSKIKRIVMEEFIPGSRHGFSAFIRNAKVVFSFLDNEHYYRNPYLVSAASVPSDVPDPAKVALIEQSEKLASILDLKTGIFHVQFVLCGEDPVIIEICRRAPGDLYIELVRHATGVEYAHWIVRASAGLDCSALGDAAITGCFVRHCIMASYGGILESVDIDGSVEGKIIDSMIWWRPGQLVDDYLKDKFGIVFLKFSNKAEMDEKAGKLQNLIHARVTV
jgi:biotin carboxylase